MERLHDIFRDIELDHFFTNSFSDMQHDRTGNDVKYVNYIDNSWDMQHLTLNNLTQTLNKYKTKHSFLNAHPKMWDLEHIYTQTYLP